MIKCKKCKRFKNKHEIRVSSKFLDGIDLSSNAVSEHGLWMCQHPDCFEYSEYNDPVYGRILSKTRISGQGILNSNNDCHRFEPDFFTRIINWFTTCSKKKGNML